MYGSAINESSAVLRYPLMVLIEKKIAVLDFIQSTAN